MQALVSQLTCDSFTEDSFADGSIDLKCKERVTDSDDENDHADEADSKVTLNTSHG